MDDFERKIQLQYLEEEIKKMKKTEKGLRKMMKDEGIKEDDELIKTLENIHSTTLSSIENKKRELKKMYNQKIHVDNN